MGRGLWAGMLVLAMVSTSAAEGIVRHRIIAGKTMEILPEPVAEFFIDHADALEEHLLAPVTSWPGDSNYRRRGDWHYVALDVGLEEQTRDERMKAAGRFPRSEDLAGSWFRKNHVRKGGQLPWVVANLHTDLIEAFKAKDPEAILSSAGYLLHFAGNCSSPFHATLNKDGSQTGNLLFGHRKPGEDSFAHQDVSFRIDYELIRRNGTRYAKKIQMSPAFYDAEGAAAGRAFETLMDSLGCLDELLSTDRDTLNKMQISTPEQFIERMDEYYIVLDDQCRDVCCDRMQAGAILAAGLIGSAWEQAGKPDLPTSLVSIPGGSEEPAESKTESGDGPAPFVGSRNSNVFHRRDCPSVKRISPDNLIEFQSAEEARRQGRKPCKRCCPSDD